MASFQIGIIQLGLDHPYCDFFRDLTGAFCDVIGFYYDFSGQQHITLFDSYSGERIGNNALTLTQIRQDEKISYIKSTPLLLNPDQRQIFQNSLARLIVRKMTSQIDDSTPKILEKIFLREDSRKFLLGVYTINTILSVLSGIDYSNIKHQIGSTLLSTQIMGESITKNIGIREGFSQKGLISSFLDTLYEKTSEVIKNCFMTQSKFRRSISQSRESQMMSLSSSSWIEEDEPIMISSSLPKTPEFGVSEKVLKLLELEDHLIKTSGRPTENDRIIEEINEVRASFQAPPIKIEQSSPKILKLRHLVENILNDISNGEIPTIQLNEMIPLINQELELHGLEPISLSSIRIGSYGALINVSQEELKEETISVNLRMGDTIVLPIRGGDLGTLETKTLEEILWYLNTLIEYHDRYIPLQMTITRELAQRKQQD